MTCRANGIDEPIYHGTIGHGSICSSFSGGVITSKSFQFSLNRDSNLDNYRVKSQGTTTAFRYTFSLPLDLDHLILIELLGNISVAVAHPGVQIDRFVSAHQIGQTVSQKTNSDTATVFNLDGFDNKTFAFNYTDLMPTPTAGDIVGIQQDHDATGGMIRYFSIRGFYI